MSALAPQDMPSFAITFTVKNEWDLLQFALPYFEAIGVARVYLFWDQTTDEAPEEVKAFNFVEARDCVSLDEIKTPGRWLSELKPETHMDHRKRLNTMFAAQEAHRAGINWISCIDPDEILLPNEGDASLRASLAAIPEDVDQIIVPNLEVFPVPREDENPFRSQTLFINRMERVDAIWRYVGAGLSRVLSPRHVAFWRHTLFRFVTAGKFPPKMTNPLTGTPIHRSLYLGYNNCKSFMRSGRAPLYNYNIHKWVAIDEAPKSIKGGRVLHYYFPSYAYFIKKFRQRPSNMRLKVFDTPYQLGEISRNASREMSKIFFEQQICCSDPAATQALLDRGIITQISDVSDVFDRLHKDTPSTSDPITS
ncbi:glycosyltransferase family 2 protein [Celeribacter sp. PS-C1]|uniref:glycosyltransferase family 2 protein n=1 Tax=Celeribacter sp. PS-C1 TaxID=2820813 RepID=UPI001C67C28C|nr:glycosyltransferase family 2 protein [Celeribacter sp. PS-C1]MBW6417903.1 glycosyltransferase family 2 protein [Celeribacter sp. PS-C1]